LPVVQKRPIRNHNRNNAGVDSVTRTRAAHSHRAMMVAHHTTRRMRARWFSPRPQLFLIPEPLPASTRFPPLMPTEQPSRRASHFICRTILYSNTIISLHPTSDINIVPSSIKALQFTCALICCYSCFHGREGLLCGRYPNRKGNLMHRRTSSRLINP